MRRCNFITVIILLACLWIFLSGCYALHKSSGAGQTDFKGPRQVNADDIALPQGYQIQPLATGLTFPTGVTFDAQGQPYVVEAGYSYGEVWTKPRLLRIEPDGRQVEIAAGGKNGPWTGVTFHNGDFYVAEGGELEGGRILRIAMDGKMAGFTLGKARPAIRVLSVKTMPNSDG